MLRAVAVQTLAFSLGMVPVCMPGQARAQGGPVVALFEIEDKESGLPVVELSKLSDFLGARLAECGYRMVPRDEIRQRLLQQKKDSYRSCFDRSCQIELGREMAAQKSMASRILRIGETCHVTAEMFDLEQATTETAATEEASCKADALLAAFRRMAEKLCRPLDPAQDRVPVSPSPARKVRRRPSPRRKNLARITVSSEPKGAMVFVNGRSRCEATPCTLSVSAGEQELGMKATHHLRREERVQVQDGQKVHWKLEPMDYSYLGMDNASVSAHLLMVGLDPGDTDFRIFSVIEGAVFTHLHPLFDIGWAVELFVYRQTPQGSSWALCDFGPAFRAGRLVVKADLQILSFKGEDWAPGISLRAAIPLATERDIGQLGFIVPVPTFGLDVLFTESLGHEQTHFWLGLGWIGNVTFD